MMSLMIMMTLNIGLRASLVRFSLARVSLTRASLARFILTRSQFGAFQFGAMPVWRVSLWRVSHFVVPKLHRSVSTSVWHVSRFAPMLIEYGEYGVARVAYKFMGVPFCEEVFFINMCVSLF